MYPLSHFLFPFLLGEILVKLNVFNHTLAILAGLIGVLIDLDHFVEHAFHYKDFSVRHAWNAAVVKHEISERTFIHHKLGFVIVTILSATLFFTNTIVFWLVFLGYYTHILLDNIDLNKIKGKILKIKEEGFVIKIPFYEIVFDILLIFGFSFLLL